MRDLRTLFEGLGHENVRTYLQSGNVVFMNRASDQKKLAAEIEHAISNAFDLDVTVVIRTHRQMEHVADGNPFPTEGTKPTSLHVMFLARPASSKAVKMLDPERSPPDEFEVRGGEVYLWLPKGSARSKLTIDYFERQLGTRATARNWNTVTKVLDLMRDLIS
jgi:uncharacterized protein (DUF1697 family)